MDDRTTVGELAHALRNVRVTISSGPAPQKYPVVSVTSEHHHLRRSAPTIGQAMILAGEMAGMIRDMEMADR